VSTAALAAQTAPAVRLVLIDEVAPLSVPSPLDNLPAQQNLAAEVQQTVHVVMPAAGGGTPQQVTAFEVGAGTPYPGQDYSLLKIDGFTNLPSLALGDGSSLQIGDTVYIDGFPGTAVDDYYRHYHRQALTRFGPVQQLAPDYPGLATFITGAHQAVAAGEDRTPPPAPNRPGSS